MTFKRLFAKMHHKRHSTLIIANFLYLIIIILLFSAAPVPVDPSASQLHRILSIAFLIFVFWLLNKFHFRRIRKDLDDESINSAEAKQIYNRTVNLNTLFGIFFFVVEVYIFNFKAIITQIPFIANSQAVMIFSGLFLFLLHLAIIWFHFYQAIGKTQDLGPSPLNYIWANLKFHSAILIPYILLLLILDLILLFNIPFITDITNLPLFQLALLFLVIVVFAPPLITLLWDCHPLKKDQLLDQINHYCSSQQVKFRRIVSWDALNKGLITAAVIGVFKFSRYHF